MMIPAESRPSVRFVASDPFGGGNLRSFWPAASLRKRGFDARSEIYLPTPVKGEWDIMAIHRPLVVGISRKLNAYHNIGCKIVIDEDDDLTRIHETKNEIGLQEWVPDAVAAHDDAIRGADAVTVATDALAEVYGKLNDNIVITRNALPADMGGIRSYLKNDVVRVGWAGITMTHRHDLEWIAPCFNDMLADAMFSNVGDIKTMRVLGYMGPVETFEFQADPTFSTS